MCYIYVCIYVYVTIYTHTVNNMYKDTYAELCNRYFICIDDGIFQFSYRDFVIVEDSAPLGSSFEKQNILTFYVVTHILA